MSKVLIKYLWFRCDVGSGWHRVNGIYDVVAGNYRYLDSSGYPSEEIAVAELLKFVGEDARGVEDFALVKIYSVVRGD